MLKHTRDIQLPAGTDPALAKAMQQMRKDTHDELSKSVDAVTFQGLLPKDFVLQSQRRPNIEYISVSGHNSIGILADGILYTACGNADALNNATTGRGLNNTTPKHGVENFLQVPIFEKIIKAGSFIQAVAYALSESGNLYLWGNNNRGQCANGTTAPVALPYIAMTDVVDVYDHPSAACLGIEHVRLFIKKKDGKVYAIGNNDQGQCGVGDNTTRNTFTEIKKTSGYFAAGEVVAVFPIGSYCGTAMLQTADGKIYACGRNAHGQLGNGNTTDKNTFIDVTAAWCGSSSGATIHSVSGGSIHYPGSVYEFCTLVMMVSCAGVTYVKTCGYGNYGALGNGALGNISTPYTVKSGTDIKKVRCTGSGVLTCHMLLTNGDLYAWGYNGVGQCGDGTTTSYSSPKKIISDVEDVFCDGTVGYMYDNVNSTFIKKTDGYIYGTGQNDIGYLGCGDTANTYNFRKSLLPKNIKLMGNFLTSSNGFTHVAVTEDNILFAFGYNYFAGISSDLRRDFPVPVQLCISPGKTFVVEEEPIDYIPNVSQSNIDIIKKYVDTKVNSNVSGLLQVVQNHINTIYSYPFTAIRANAVEISCLSTSIAIMKAQSKILIDINLCFESAWDGVFILIRSVDGIDTEIGSPDAVSSMVYGISSIPYDVDNNSTMQDINIKYLDSPGASAGKTIKYKLKIYGTSSTFHLNRTTADSSGYERATSNVLLTEISA